MESENNKNKQSFLPSKKFLLQFFVIVVVIGGIVFLLYRRSNKITINNLQQTQKMAIRDIVDKDTDEDNVRDWEEILFGTSPYSKDTNNDGVGDKEEIDAKKLKLGTNINDENNPLNDTEKFSQELFATIVSLKETGSLNAQNITELSNKLGESIGAQKELPDIYTGENTTLTGLANKSSLIGYNSKFQKLINKYKDKNMGIELEITATAVQSGDYSGLLDLPTIAKTYEDYAKEYVAIPVPKDILELHLFIANNFAKTGIAIKNMSELSTNPLVGLLGVSQYKIYSKNIDNGLEELGIYLRKNAIIK